MPIYEYECQECGKVFEAIQKFSDPELTACRCEKEAPVKKLISAAAFHLKGSGWYVTDFRDKGKKKPSESSGSEGSSADSKAESKSEAESESKSESKSGSKSDSSSSSSSDASSASSSAAAD